MFHIDRNNKIQLKITEELKVYNATLNPRAKLFMKNLKGFVDEMRKIHGDVVVQIFDPYIVAMEKFNLSGIEIQEIMGRFHPEGEYKKVLSPDSLKSLNGLRIETAFEKVRQDKFKDRISRLSGIYLTKNTDEWSDFYTSEGAIYEFDISNSKVEEYDSNWFTQSKNLEISEIENRAEKYWNGDPTQIWSKTEFLGEGSFIVAKKSGCSI